MKTQQETPKRKRRKRWYIVLISILVLLVAFRLMLPYIVLRYVNKQLAGLEDYYGHVQDIDIHLIRGAYVIQGMKISKLDRRKAPKDTIPFFTSSEIDLSLEWRALFKGRIVGKVDMRDPVLNFVKGKHKNEDIKQDTADFRELANNLMPLTVNTFRIRNGQMHYIDLTSSPRIDIAMKEIDALASNITNVNDSNKLLPARLTATGSAYEGSFNMLVDFDGLNKVPTFDLTARLKNLNLVKLNPFLQAYGNFDVKKGRFGLYTEFAAKEGRFGGYVKPLITDLDVVQWNKEEGDFKQILWETIIATAAELFQNQRTETLATKVPINGKFSDPDIRTWDAVSYVLRNAFVQALKPAIDNTISINKLEDDKKTFLERIFGKKDDKAKEERREERKKKKEERKEKRAQRKEEDKGV